MRELDIEDLAEIMGEFVDLSGVEVREDAVLGQDIPLDSRQMMRVISRLETQYRVRFAPTDLLTTRTLGDLLRVTRRRAGLA